MDQGQIIGDEQNARGVAIKPPNRRDRWIALQPAGWQEIVDPPTFALIMRADAARRLVQNHEEALGKLQGRVVKPDRRRHSLATGIVLHHVPDGHTPGGNQFADLAAGSVAKTGKNLLDATGCMHVHRENQILAGAPPAG